MINAIYGITVDFSGWAAALQRQDISEPIARKSADDLEKEVAKNLGIIDTFDTGKAVLDHLQKTKKSITIKNGSEGFTKPLNWETATLQGAQRLHCGGPNAGQKVSPAQKGKGGGSDVDVLWHPKDLTCSGGKKCAGNQADEVLFHELTHALRFAAGKSNCVSMTGKYKSYGDEEEFYAIVISNIYLSEKGKTDLRADHGFEMGVLDADEQKDFVKRHRERLAKLKSQQQTLYDALTKIEPKGGFNPIRQMK